MSEVTKMHTGRVDELRDGWPSGSDARDGSPHIPAPTAALANLFSCAVTR